MNDLMRALGISAGILLLVVALTIGVSIVAVRRGEASLGGHAVHEEESHAVAETAAAAPVAKAAAKPAAAAVEEISVIQILLLGTGLFVVVVLLLLGLSLIQHM